MRLSWSRFQSFDSCKLQYSLRYKDRLKVRKPRMPFIVGSAVHNTIKEWARHGFPPKFVEKIITVEFRKELGGIYLADRSVFTKLLQRAIRGALYTERIFQQLKLPEHGVVVEDRFNEKFPGPGNHRIIGGYDAYDPYDETVYDLKMYTTNTKPDKRQLLTYAIALRQQESPVSNGAFITPLMPNSTKIIKGALSGQEIEDHLGILTDAIVDMEAGVDPVATPGYYCMFCEFRATANCPATAGGISSSSGGNPLSGVPRAGGRRFPPGTFVK